MLRNSKTSSTLSNTSKINRIQSNSALSSQITVITITQSVISLLNEQTGKKSQFSMLELSLKTQNKALPLLFCQKTHLAD
jgi:hypothetical protein